MTEAGLALAEKISSLKAPHSGAIPNSSGLENRQAVFTTLTTALKFHFFMNQCCQIRKSIQFLHGSGVFLGNTAGAGILIHGSLYVRYMPLGYVSDL